MHTPWPEPHRRIHKDSARARWTGTLPYSILETWILDKILVINFFDWYCENIKIGWDYSFFLSFRCLYCFLTQPLIYSTSPLITSSSCSSSSISLTPSHSIIFPSIYNPEGRFWESASRRIRWYWHGWNESTYTSTYNWPIIVWKHDFCSVWCLNLSVILFHFILIMSLLLFVTVFFIHHVMSTMFVDLNRIFVIDLTT